MTFEVRNGNDDGADSLRHAIESANTTGGHDTIFIKDSTYDFNHKITLASNLPPITDGVTIYTQSGGVVYIDCQSPAVSRGLLVEISDAGHDDTVSFTNIGVANASGAAFRLGGSELNTATLTKCWVHGSSPSYNAGEGFLIESCDASNITLTDCDVWRRQTGISLAASAHVTTLNIEGAQILASNCTPSPANWVGIKCEGTGRVLIQDHIEPVNGIPTVVRESRIYDIPGTAIYLNGQGSTNLQAEITGIEIGTVGPISGNGIVVENWRICRGRDVLFQAA